MTRAAGGDGQWNVWAKTGARPRSAGLRALGGLVVGALGLALSTGLSGCIFGNEECPADRQRCTAEGREVCIGGEGYTHWSPKACEAETPFCVETRPELNQLECAAEPHCSATSACQRRGLCADSAQGCVATAEGCARSCPDGQCGFDGSQCVSTDAGCTGDPICKSKGLCAAGGVDCRATAAGCAASDFCKSGGYCGFNGVVCVPSLEGCKGSELCRSEGWCGFSNDDGSCNVTPQGCAASESCTSVGRCFAGPTLCEANAESCARSSDCAERGFCRVQEGTCVQ